MRRPMRPAPGKAGAGGVSGPYQGGTVSFRGGMDCEALAQALARRGFALRAGLHCAPQAHESAGTLDTGTVRASFGYTADPAQADALAGAVKEVLKTCR